MFLNYINAFRAIAIFFVISSHSILVLSWDHNPEQKKIADIVVSNGTIFFLFIAGYLFQHLSFKFNTKKYYLSKFNNVLVPYFIISIPLVLYYVFISPRYWDTNFIAQPLWLQVFYYYWLSLHLYSLWFIPVIAMFYLIGPILVKVDKSDVLYLLIPFLMLISLLTPRSLYPTENFIHFFSIYVLGMFCSKYKVKINIILAKVRVIFYFILLFLCVSLVEYFALFPNFITINYVQKVFLIFAVLGLLIRYEQYTKSNIIEIIANTSFGVYFLHPYLLIGVKYISRLINKHFLISLHNQITGNIFTHFLLSSFTLMLSILLVMLIKRTLGNKTYLLIGHIPQFKSIPK